MPGLLPEVRAAKAAKDGAAGDFKSMKMLPAAGSAAVGKVSRVPLSVGNQAASLAWPDSRSKTGGIRCASVGTNRPQAWVYAPDHLESGMPGLNLLIA